DAARDCERATLAAACVARRAAAGPRGPRDRGHAARRARSRRDAHREPRSVPALCDPVESSLRLAELSQHDVVLVGSTSASTRSPAPTADGRGRGPLAGGTHGGCGAAANAQAPRSGRGALLLRGIVLLSSTRTADVVLSDAAVVGAVTQIPDVSLGDARARH